MNPAVLQMHFKRLLKKAGLHEHVKFHSIRRSCATLLRTNGTPMEIISDILGHASTRITDQTYAKMWLDEQRAATTNLGQKLTG
jgi:integrase